MDSDIEAIRGRLLAGIRRLPPDKVVLLDQLVAHLECGDWSPLSDALECGDWSPLSDALG